MISDEVITKSEKYDENIINTVREPLIVLDQDLRVLTVSRSFYEVFQVKPAETVGHLIYDLGNKQWDIPKLRELLETILPEKTSFDDYEVEHDFATIGRRTMLLNARQIKQGRGKERIILLAIEDITERKEIEDGLETTRKELAVIKKSADEAYEFAESVINTVREPLISLDQDLRVVTVSHSFYEFFQVTPEETVGQLIYDLGNKQWDIPLLRELLETILPAKTSFNDYEVEHDFTTIGRHTMLLNARQIERGRGKERIILLAIEDITERKRLEDLLKESEFRYRRVFETASDGIVLLEKGEGHIVHANQAIEKMLGYSAAEYTGKKLLDIGVSLDTSDFPAIMQELDKSGILNYEDVPVKTKSGQDVPADIYMVDRAHLAQCNIRDISDRKRAAEALQEEKLFTENALNTLQDIFLVFDLEGRFLRWNKALNVVTGYIDTEIALMKPTDFFRNDDTRKITEAFQTAVREGNVTIEVLIFSKDKRPIPYEFNAVLLNDAHGKPVGITGVARDITERKKLEAQLLQAQKMEAVGTLAGGIAHDFNNILNIILGYGAMVMDTLAADSQSNKDMKEVLLAADRAADLTKRLLVFSRKQAVEVRFININALILGLHKMLARIIRKSIDFHLDLADRPLNVQADSGQLEQVLINLVVNARDAIEEGGRLTISTGLEEVNEEYVAAYGYGKPGRYALITVADTGQGMDAETQKRTFEPFFTTKGVGKGTGLGLAISYGIIKQHNGYIKVYSEQGQGTVFKIYLPLSEAVALPDTKMEDVVTVKGGNETILVAEDDAALRKLTRIVLESFGYTVLTAEDGEDAITKFMENRESIRLVVLDMIMPKKSGKEVSVAIRKVSPEIKILFASGYTLEIIMNKELTEGVFDFIQKPFQSKDLLAKVREVLDR
ncbi:MAG: PAS domain S-box protein [Desulfoarculaceae bacterium]|nr:PAS domain S-box protein [Desulfoarculaceae bacterium]